MLAAPLLALLALATPMAGQPARAADPPAPSRIVSLDLCADELVLQLADRNRVAGVSFLAADAGLSPFAAETRGLTLVHGNAEEVMALHPDLVIAGPFGAPAAVQMLHRLGMPLLHLPALQDLDAVHAAVRQIAAALHEPARGEHLLQALDATLAAAAPPPSAPWPSALIYQANGIVVGADSLQSAVLTQAGLHNVAPALGLPNGGYLSLERLIAARPTLLVIDSYRPDLPSLAEQFLQHPALRALLHDHAPVRVPSSLWYCPGPGLGQAAMLLADARRAALGEARP